MVGIRRKIHANPELGYEEFETSELIRVELDQMSIEYKHPVGVTGVVGFIGTQKPPFVAIRADMDALTMQEMVEWVHKSKNAGKMHACGHDAHVAMLLGAAKILKEHEQDLQGTVVLVFQPAEEGGAGAKKMIAGGALENVSAIFGLHVANHVPIAEVASRPATISGKGGHAALPHHAVDPILAASNVIVSLQHLVSREADPLDSQVKPLISTLILIQWVFIPYLVSVQVITVGKFQGGDAFNILSNRWYFPCIYNGKPNATQAADEAGKTVNIAHVICMLITSYRLINYLYNDSMMFFFYQVITGQASVHRCLATVNFFEDEKPLSPPTINHKDLHEHFRNVAGDMLGFEKVKDHQRWMGSEDFAYYQEAIPGYFSFLGMADDALGPLPMPHSPYFRINEDALPYGAALHASFAARYLLEFQQEVPLPEREHHDEL
ncbi:hypothetical protein DVH24_000319 [Malus domestica]|uniref:Peptidase M20 dimerisation domain-containing protein n=1 Tax=Malus domestica TaxID=3750 RepID=A0A498IZK6_MALDO|nr:hypothetical protein DVH24_000319 [Malus domestica]